MAIVQLKECKHHGLTEFAVRADKRYPGKHKWRCKQCEYESVKRRRKKVKEKLVNLHGGKCQRCGYSKSLRALSFHHKDPKQKKFGLSSSNFVKWNLMVKEATKCDLICANCHMELEDEKEAAS